MICLGMTHAPLHPEVASAMARAMWARHKLPVQDRFWSKVDVVKEDECWEWIGWRNKAGYGVFNLEHKTGQTGVKILAPRMAWQLTNGPIPEGRYILHRCDNPPCVNPKHLFVGTIKDNQQDMWAKGRGKGFKPILTEEQVREIRSKYKRGEYGYIRLAKEYGVGMSTVHDIIVGKNWKRV